MTWLFLLNIYNSSIASFMNNKKCGIFLNVINSSMLSYKCNNIVQFSQIWVAVLLFRIYLKQKVCRPFYAAIYI